MKKSTLSADESLIKAARARAAEHTPLHEQFRLWPEDDARQPSRMQPYDTLIAELYGKVRVGQKLSRHRVRRRRGGPRNYTIFLKNYNSPLPDPRC